MTLVEAFEQLWARTEPAFSQQRVLARARQLAYGFITAWGRHTVSRALCALHAQFEDWSASYRLFSRSPWKPHDLFQPVLEQGLAMSGSTGLIPVALDDTTLKKSSKRIPGVSYARDPMSPPFHPNLMLGQRFIQASLNLRPEALEGPARGIPIRFEPAPPPTKPGKRAGEEEWAAYRQAQKTQTLSWKAVGLMQDIRASVDQAGHAHRVLLFATDGSYCNGTVFRHLPERVEVVARARGDMNLFLPLTEEERESGGRRRKYGAPLPKPKEIRASDAYPWQEAEVFGAGRLHDLRYKVVSPVLWRSGTRTQPLRLLIIAPLGYRRTSRSRLLYRDPAYLLTTDLTAPVETLIQAYFDRWEIEVNHRDEKSLFGVGQAQVWAAKAAPRVPQFQVAVYAMLLLASLMAYGPKRTDHYMPLPKWRKQEDRRPSILDILVLLREELVAQAVSSGLTQRYGPSKRPGTRPIPVPLAG
ncbi:MAG: transposase [Acidobacteriaceae bacterium]